MKGATRGLREGWMKENYLRLMPGLSVEDRTNWYDKFKMVASDLVSVRGQVMEYPYIPTGIKGEMVRSGN